MMNDLNFRMTFNSYKRDRFQTKAYIMFVTVAVFLFATTLMLFVNLSGAIDELMDKARVCDFLQMHSGEYDEAALQSFAESNEYVEDFQVIDFLNLENSRLYIGDKSLADSTQDNGLCVNSDRFDFLLGMNNERPTVNAGEIYVPICYRGKYDIAVGCNMLIGDKAFNVAGFIRDAQMNSMLSSSKRFLVNEADYLAMRDLGSEEYLIEFLLKSGADETAFKTAYEEADLPSNGPTVTRPLIKLMNELSDGIMIMVILLFSIIVLAISFVCIRFMLVTRLLCEQKEIGFLKALGIRGRDIKRMFLIRYSILSFCGSIIGIVISYIVFNPLSKQIRDMYGTGKNTVAVMLSPFAGAALIFAFTLLFIKRLLKRMNRMTAVDAMRYERCDNSVSGIKRSYIGITLVAILGMFLMIVPSCLNSTMASGKFVTYMGIGESDLRIDLRQDEGIEAAMTVLSDLFSKDDRIEEYAIYTTGLEYVTLPDGKKCNILIEQGDHTRFPVNYASGYAPSVENEIALSSLLADELSLKAGDKIINNGCGEVYTVSGIYSDITNGGKTSKLYKAVPEPKDIIWCISYMALKSKDDIEAFEEDYTTKGYEVVGIEKYIQETYGQTIELIGRISILIRIVAALIIFLVVTMFFRMIIMNEKDLISTKKAIGFTSRDCVSNYLKSVTCYGLAGVAAGLFIAVFVGQELCEVVISSLGAVGFTFIPNYFDVALAIPSIAIAALALAVYPGVRIIRGIKATDCLI